MPCSLATSAVTCVDSYGSSSSSFGLRKCCSLRIGCSLRNVSKIAALFGEIEIAVLREQALEDELVRGAAAQPDVGALVMDDLVGAPVELRGQPRVAERGQRIGGDGDFVVLANGNERGHGLPDAVARRGATLARRGKPEIIPCRRERFEARRRRKHRDRRQARGFHAAIAHAQNSATDAVHRGPFGQRLVEKAPRARAGPAADRRAAARRASASRASRRRR